MKTGGWYRGVQGVQVFTRAPRGARGDSQSVWLLLCLLASGVPGGNQEGTGGPGEAPGAGFKGVASKHCVYG